MFLALLIAAQTYGPQHLPPVIDRKSTRLNSSHLVISYAVFCLKKKTRTDQWLGAAGAGRAGRVGRRMTPEAFIRANAGLMARPLVPAVQLYLSSGLAPL